jgi:mycobactin peptide synthetase MbtF
VLLLCVHHLATDVVSWYVMLSELRRLADELAAGRTPTHEVEYTPYREWTRLLEQRSHTDDVSGQRAYWAAQLAGPDPVLGSRLPDPTRDTRASQRLTDVVTDTATTRTILHGLDTARIDVRDFLLAALTVTIASWRLSRGEPAHHGALIALEGHGREDGLVGEASVDTSATVGWFTSVYPVRLGAGRAAIDVDTAAGDPAAARTLLGAVTETLAAVPNRGLDYGLLRWLRKDPALASHPGPQVEFNYVGRYDLQPDRAAADWTLVTDETLNAQLPVAAEPDLPLRYTFDVIAVVLPGPDGPQLRTSWRWSDRLSTADELEQLTALWSRAVTALGGAL